MKGSWHTGLTSKSWCQQRSTSSTWSLLLKVALDHRADSKKKKQQLLIRMVKTSKPAQVWMYSSVQPVLMLMLSLFKCISLPFYVCDIKFLNQSSDSVAPLCYARLGLVEILIDIQFLQQWLRCAWSVKMGCAPNGSISSACALLHLLSAMDGQSVCRDDTWVECDHKHDQHLNSPGKFAQIFYCFYVLCTQLITPQLNISQTHLKLAHTPFYTKTNVSSCLL